MTDLDKLLNDVKAPEPRTSLKSDILKEARAQRPRKSHAVAANDNKWVWVSGLAACLLFISIFTVSFLRTPDLQAPTSITAEAKQWAEAAEVIGYDDLYAWVNEADTAEETEVQYN